MSEFSISSQDFKEGEEIPKECGYKHGNVAPWIGFNHTPKGTKCEALIMDDPDAMGAVGKVWVHWLYYELDDDQINGKTDFGEIGYGGPAPPDKRHTYVFKAYALEEGHEEPKEGYSKQELEDLMDGSIIAEVELTGTYAP